MNTEKCNACDPKFCEACPDYWVDKTSGDNVVLTKILGAVSEALDKSAAHRVVHIPLIITDQMIEDIIVTAIEGGISYWCKAVNAPKGTPYITSSYIKISNCLFGILAVIPLSSAKALPSSNHRPGLPMRRTHKGLLGSSH